jgi:hypothetical protein
MTIEDSPEEKRMIVTLNRGECPDCGNYMIVPGPRGGLSRNVSCDACGSRFNVAPWHFDHAPHNFMFVQRIGK